jgi:hypothetical protein
MIVHESFQESYVQLNLNVELSPTPSLNENVENYSIECLSLIAHNICHVEALEVPL